MTHRASLAATVFLLSALSLPAWGEQYYLYESKAVTDQEKKPGKDGVLVIEVPVEKGDTLYNISRKFTGRGTYYPQILLFNKIEDPNLIYAGKTIKVPVVEGESRTQPAPVKESAVKSKRHNVKGKKVAKSKVVARAQAHIPSQAPAKQPPAIHSAASPSTELSLTDLKRVDESNSKKHAEKKKVATQPPVRDKNENVAVASQAPARDKKEKIAAAAKVGGDQKPASDTAAGQKLFEKAVKAYRQDDCSVALELFDRYLTDNSSSPLAADASLFKAECYLKLSTK